MRAVSKAAKVGQRCAMYGMLGAVLAACGTEAPLQSERPRADEPEPEPATSEQGSLDDTDELPGKTLNLQVTPDTAVHISLGDAAEVRPGELTATNWDLKFEGLRVYTNGGVSGDGAASAFGPGDQLDFLYDDVPAVPFMREDRTGGAFLDWYAYDNGSHQLYSRYHVYGVRSGDAFWKVQIMGYYGEEFGAPVGALYSLRYARTDGAGPAQVREISGIDATAGASQGTEHSPSACLDLDSGQVLMLAPAEALASEAWHLCFRRESISVNGGVAGPGNVSAIDLDAAQLADETDQVVADRTADSELQRFENVDQELLANPAREYLQDAVYSAFGDLWYQRTAEGIEPVPASWLVLGANGVQHYLVVFLELEALAAERYNIKLQVRPVE